jgi:hypothetical protein
MGNDEGTVVLLRFSLRISKRPFDRLTALSGAEGLKRNRNSHSKFDIGYWITNEIRLQSAATSLFDVQRWMFDVQSVLFSTFIFLNNPVQHKYNQ